MNEILIFLLGVCFGTVSTFWGIMLFSKRMDKNKKEVLIKIGKDKWMTKKN